MLNRFKNTWEITHNWQLIYPFLGILASGFSGYLIAKGILKSINFQNTALKWSVLMLVSLTITYLIIHISLWCFKKLEHRWKVNFRWEFIAIFLVFAVTGSTAGKISDPFMNLVGLAKETTSGWLYWPVRILLIFPIYQVLLVIFGWLFGKYRFFRDFAIKMTSRMGLRFLFPKQSR